MPNIELKNLTKKFDGSFVAVDNLSITIEDGDFITLLGPSGCGKTTTLRQIAGLETPTSGTITIDGKVVFSSDECIDVSPAERGVGFLFQNYALWPHMTVYQNIAFGLENLKWDKADIDKRVKELLKLLRIEDFPDRYPAELSGGQQQRVAIARTLATNPRVLLMDEPLSNLDAKLRMEMRAELKRLHHETGATFVYVTHDQLEAMTLATKICLLDKGKLQQYAPPLTVYSKPANTFVADFVGNPTINMLKASVTGIATDGSLSLQAHNIAFTFKPTEKVNCAQGDDIIIGIRPEYISLADSGLAVTVVSSLPGGMETILKVRVDNDVEFTSVLFGLKDYAVGEKLFITFPTDSCVLFDKDTNYASCGKLTIE
ncbi:MAG: ABC transporter ATP-binding protein [Treponema sp.]|nr:ABC transporter ATP-binding protein [Treponema sp.]